MDFSVGSEEGTRILHDMQGQALALVCSSRHVSKHTSIICNSVITQNLELTNAHVCTKHTNTHALTQSHTQSYIQTQTHNTHIRTHAHAHTHAHKCTHTHTCTHTYTHQAVFLLIGKTSALTMNIAGVIKDWMLIFFSFYLFKAPLTRMNLAGYAFCCSGVRTLPTPSFVLHNISDGLGPVDQNEADKLCLLLRSVTLF